jgi:hypothetical protein
MPKYRVLRKWEEVYAYEIEADNGYEAGVIALEQLQETGDTGEELEDGRQTYIYETYLIKEY